MRASRRRFVQLAAMALPLAACGHRRAVSHAGAARRIVTLGPNATEIFFALGAGDRVVGVSRYDDYPPEVSRLPRVGGLVDPSFEAIVELHPDAVAGAQGPLNRAVLDRLESLGVRMVFPRVESLADIRAAITAFGDLVALPDPARALRSRIDTDVAAEHARVANLATLGVLAVFGQRPITVAGPGSFVDELLTLANARNVVRTGPKWPSLALEAVLSLAPDVILDLTSMEHLGSLADAWSGYTSIPAVRNGRIVRLDDPMLLRPGPRIAQALAVYARAIHPDAAA